MAPITSFDPPKLEPSGITTTVPELRLFPKRRVHEFRARDVPYVLRGRDWEFSVLSAGLSAMPREIACVMGPPGTGKTSVISAVARYSSACGFKVVSLEAAHLASIETFERVVAQRVGSPTKSGERQTTAAEARVNTGVFGASLGMEREVVLQAEAAGVIVSQAEQYVLARGQRGILFTLDETQHLEDYLMGTSEPAVKGILRYLNDGIKLPGATVQTHLICGGLSRTREVLRQAGISRTNESIEVYLRGIGVGDSEAVLWDHLDVSDDNGILPADVDGEWVKELAKKYHVSAYQTGAAGFWLQATAFQARVEGRERLNESDQQAVEKAIHDQILRMYANRTSEVSKTWRPVIHALAQAVVRFGNQLPRAGTQRLMQLVTEKTTGGDSDSWQEAETALAREGVLELWEPARFASHLVDAQREQEIYTFVIPSMATYFENQRLLDQEQVVKQGNVMPQTDWEAEITESFGTKSGELVNPWRWLDGHPLVPAIPKLPTPYSLLPAE